MLLSPLRRLTLLVAVLFVGASAAQAPAQAQGQAPVYLSASGSGSGCPVELSPEMKLVRASHPGQWFTANYPFSLCGEDDTQTTWTVVRVDAPKAPFVTDVCYTPLDWATIVASGLKRCERPRGKILHIVTPGVYTVTATAPRGVGAATLENVVVD